MSVARKTEPEYMTSGEAARALGLTIQHVHNLAVQGHLPVAIRTSAGMRLFLASDVERLAKEREEAPPRPGPEPGKAKKKATKVTKKTTKGRATKKK